MDLTRYQVEKLKSEPEKFYLIVSEPECTNVCFWYIPTRLRSEKRDHWWQDELGKATAVLKVRGCLGLYCTVQYCTVQYCTVIGWLPRARFYDLSNLK